MVNGKKVNDVGWEDKYGKMVLFMKDIGVMIWLMERED